MMEYLAAEPGSFLGELSKKIHEISSNHGFWPEEGRNFGEMISLAHSELSEALEEHRDDHPAFWEKHEESCPIWATNNRWGVPCDCNLKPEGAAVELIDCIIRCLDMFNHPSLQGVDIDGIMLKKMLYNESRPYKHGRNY